MPVACPLGRKRPLRHARGSPPQRQRHHQLHQVTTSAPTPPHAGRPPGIPLSHPRPPPRPRVMPSGHHLALTPLGSVPGLRSQAGGRCPVPPLRSGTGVAPPSGLRSARPPVPPVALQGSVPKATSGRGGRPLAWHRVPFVRPSLRVRYRLAPWAVLPQSCLCRPPHPTGAAALRRCDHLCGGRAALACARPWRPWRLRACHAPCGLPCVPGRAPFSSGRTPLRYATGVRSSPPVAPPVPPRAHRGRGSDRPLPPLRRHSAHRFARAP